jgi:major vault protein
MSVDLEQSVVQCMAADKGEYLVLENPSQEDGGLKHPSPKNNNTSVPDLKYGTKIVVPGPCKFALWPEQDAVVIEGHHLRTDQYLLVRVYDEDAAAANWEDAVAKTVDDDSEEETVVNKSADELGLTLGKLLIIKGSEVSFYIPPTGVEVIPDDEGEYIRDALTLEMSEYAILVDQKAV